MANRMLDSNKIFFIILFFFYSSFVSLTLIKAKGLKTADDLTNFLMLLIAITQIVKLSERITVYWILLYNIAYMFLYKTI